MSQKYEFIQADTVKFQGRVLTRIRRLSDGLVGGYIESQSNLSQTGTCFAFDDSRVCENSRVTEDAKVYGIVYGNAVISGRSVIYGQAYDNATVSGDSIVKGQIFGNASIKDQAQLIGQAYGRSVIQDRAVVKGIVYGDAHIEGDQVITGVVGQAQYGSVKACLLSWDDSSDALSRDGRAASFQAIDEPERLTEPYWGQAIEAMSDPPPQVSRRCKL